MTSNQRLWAEYDAEIAETYFHFIAAATESRKPRVYGDPRTTIPFSLCHAWWEATERANTRLHVKLTS